MTAPQFERYVIVHRSYDPLQTDMLGDILRENGISARVLGTRHGAGIGAAQNILQVHIEVPQSQAGQATDFLEAFFEGDGEGLLREHAGLELSDDRDDDQDDDRDDDQGAGGHADGQTADQPDGEHREHASSVGAEDGSDDGDVSRESPGPGRSRPDPFRPLFAAGAVLLLFGGSHLYSRRLWTTAVLAAGQVVAVASVLSMRWDSVVMGMAMFFTLLVFDAAGGQWAVRQARRGVRTSIGRQLFAGAVFVALAGAIGWFLGPRIPAPELRDQPVGQIHAPLHIAAE
ncbi:MAG: hypothetical protein MJE77_07290 [Proteobacteria bacterium]|nr:hypothetical protein [Pseudomonadota bacterium]